MAEPSAALITGATEGIGQATAFALGRAGYRIGVCARTEAKVERLLAELRAEGIDAAGAAADVNRPEQVDRLAAHVAAAFGAIDVLVNNAGRLVAKRIEALTLDEWDAVMATNLRGLFVVTRAVLPAMRRRQRGTIVNVASLAGRHGFVGGTAYAASKHGVLGFSRSLMLEVRRDNVRVVTICPGSVDTAMLHDQPLLPGDPARMLQPEDVAAAILQTLQIPDRALVSELDIRPTIPGS